jgi:hypothetical protein
MCSRAEGLPRVDDEIDDVRARVRPGRTNPDALRDQHGLVERLPALRPVVGHSLASHSDADSADFCLSVREGRQLAGRSVERVLHEAVAVHLLHPARRELQQLREHLLGRIGRRSEGQPDQRNARRSLPTIDSSAGSLRLSSVSESRSSPSSSF